MPRITVAVGYVLVALLALPAPAHGHVRGSATAPGSVHVVAGQPISVSPPAPRTVLLNSQGDGTLTGTLSNPNGFHRWGRPVQITITNVTPGTCRANQISIQPTAPPAGGAAIAPNGARAWTVTFDGPQGVCKNANLTVTYSAAQ
jgi:hypothetical protein